MEQMHQRNERLIENKIWKYLLPGIMMSLALQLGNIVDTVFVGNFLGSFFFDLFASRRLHIERGEIRY